MRVQPMVEPLPVQRAIVPGDRPRRGVHGLRRQPRRATLRELQAQPLLLPHARDGVQCSMLLQISHTLYKVNLVVMELGWIDFDLNVTPCRQPAQQIQPSSHLPKHNQEGSVNDQNLCQSN